MSAVHFPAADTRRLIVAAIPEWLNAQDDLASRKMVPFLPASHARALHFRVPLVVGIRGSGKSLWCSILGNIEQRNKLIRQINDFSIDPSVQVYTGFAEQGNPGDFPGRGVLADLMAKFPLPDIWRAIMAHHVLETEQKPPFYGWEQRVRWVREHRESIDNAFYQTDEQLRDKKQHRLVLFDALDRTADDWGTMQRMLKELLMLLLEFRSFQAIHPKAFVRPDLLSDPAVTAFPDSSKLIANKESLLWPPRDLYNLLWHLLANHAAGGDRFRAVCEREFGLPWHQEEGLWLIPDALRIEEPRQRQVLHAITGPFMGRDPKRGIPYTWLVNHLADSLQQISPRSFLAAVRKAAQGDLSEPRVYPLQGDDIRLGVQEASRIRVAEVEEDVPWVAQLMKPLAGLIIPASFNEIAKRWQDDDSLERIRKGSAQGNRRLYPRRMDLEGEAGVGRDLEELGIFQRLKNDRINLPDVYRIGFNLRRKGGIPAIAAERPIKADAAAVPEPAIIHPWSGLSILHLSDLHFGEHCRFAEMDPAELGERTAKSVQEVLPKNQRLDLVIVTGDLTEQAKPNQFRQVHAFLDALAGAAGINRDRFVLLPGNHDVSRAVCLRVMSELEEQDIFTDEAFFQRVETEKFNNFEDFLSGFLASRDHIQSLERGGRIWNFPRLRLSVAALNSCERITHRPDETRGQLSAEQVESFLASWGKGSDRLKILALHHNPSGVPQQSIEGWNTYIDQEKRLSKEQIECILDDAGGFQDKGRVQQLVRQCHPQLLLYGHQHASMENDLWRWDTDGYTSLLGAGSLGIVEEKLPKDFPNACQLIEITVDGKMKIVPLEYDPRAGVSGKADPGRFISRETAKPLTLCLPEGLFAEERPIPERTSPRRTSFLAAYRQRFTDARPRWDLSHTGVALAMGFKPEQAALNDMYLPLRLGEKDDPDALDLGAVLSSGEVVNLTQPMIIRGQAGAGKTTWIRWTFHQLLQLNHTLPIKIELRSLASYWERVPREQSSVEGYLEDWMKNEYRMGGWYDELMAFLEHPGSVRPVLLIDGWDELGDLGHDFRDKLRKFLNTHPSVRCVVTSRPYGAGRPTGGDGFAERVIQPLNKGEIQELVTKFFRHAVDSPDTARNIDEFIAALERSEKAGEMARTALLLTLMLLISRTAPLPEKRVDLFEQCVKTMIGTIPDKRKEQGAKRRAEAWAPDDPHERIRVTADLAHAIQSDDRIRVTVNLDWTIQRVDVPGGKQFFRTAKLLAREEIVQLKWGAGWTGDDKTKFTTMLLGRFLQGIGAASP
ncbi:MAG: metallophosphoesterase, partial [Magnetococcales bacterium]|nr:metallophosphoesterase [Magnetococcales bacterium]